MKFYFAYLLAFWLFGIFMRFFFILLAIYYLHVFDIYMSFIKILTSTISLIRYEKRKFEEKFNNLYTFSLSKMYGNHRNLKL